MKNNIILGSGISALIFKFYNKDFTIISPDSKTGGQLNFDIAGKVFLFKDEYSERLLKDLKIKAPIKQLPIHYFSEGKLHSKPTPSMIERYMSKKTNHHSYNKNNIIKSKGARNIKDSYYYDVNLNKLIEKLSMNINIIREKAILINTHNKYITLSNYVKINYDKLISTIPMQDFRYIAYDWEMKEELRYLPTTILLVDKLPTNLQKYEKELGMCQYSDDDIPISRVWKENGNYLFEITGDISLKDCEEYFNMLGIKILKHSIKRVGFIFNKNITPPKDILFVGRLACWNSDYFINTSIKDAINYKNGNDTKTPKVTH